MGLEGTKAHRLTVGVKRRGLLPGNGEIWAQVIAWGLVLLYIVAFTRLAILRHASFNSSGFDLGLFDQAVWNTLRGRIFFYTTTGQPLLHLSNHADLILFLVAPFYLIYSGPEMLLFLQTAVIGLGGLPLFWLAREKLESNLAGLSLLLAYLLFPTLEVVNLWDFHPPALAAGFLMYAFYFLDRRKSGWFLFFAVLAMASKEQIPLVVVFLGLYAMARYRNWVLGILTVVLAMGYFVLVMYWIIPTHSVTGEHLFLGYYSYLGDSPLEIVGTAITRPDLVLENLWQPAKLAYLRDVLTPFAYLPLLGLPVLLIGLPMFAINLLSLNSAMYDASGGQYGADVAPWLAWGALFGALYLRQGLSRVWPAARPWLTYVISLSLLLVSIIWHVFHGFSPLALSAPNWEITNHDRLAQRFMAQIPPGAPISVQGKLYPHLSNRMIAYQFPDVNDAEYVFLDVTTGTWPIHPNDLKTKVDELLDSGEFGVLDAADGYILLRRGVTNRTLPDAFYDFARPHATTPQYPLEVEFEHDLRLLGFDVLDEAHREQVEDVRRGQMAVRLYWQALHPIDSDLRLYPFFLNAQGDLIEDTQQRPLIAQLWYPPRQWRPGEIVITETMPWQLGDQWSLAAGVLAGPDWSDWSQRLKVRAIESPTPVRRFQASTWVYLASFEQSGRRLVEVALPVETGFQPSRPLQANLAGKMGLRGYDLSPGTGQAGRDLEVTLYWQALAPMDRDYTVFVHLVDRDGQLVAQHDSQPWWQMPLPTSTWQPGEELPDQHRLTLPPDLEPGTYYLQVGAYHWQTLERLSVIENNVPVNNYVDLGNLAVER
ncbi:MAG: DUF2079 domain-containing protein [Anaerolineales bacterium]|nr:MAG: DUF2079 domain-containing protein [Anaerolineales bacterium]